jgi:hypothetical protein
MIRLEFEDLAQTSIPKTLSVSVFEARGDMAFFEKERHVQEVLVIT